MKLLLVVLVLNMVLNQDLKMSVNNNAMTNVSSSLASDSITKNVVILINTFYPTNYYKSFDAKNLSIYTSQAVNCKDNTIGCYSAISRIRYNDLSFAANTNNYKVSMINEN
jgi:hypothetical protein